MEKKKDSALKVTKTELVWPGKRTEVERVELPFQTIEILNLPRGQRQESIFDTPTQQESFVREKNKQQTLKTQVNNEWKNRLIWGDNFLVMNSLLKDFAGKINLIYIDPPFATGADFSFEVQIGDREITKEPSAMEVKAYRDTWGKGLQSYLQMMYIRLVLMKELLADGGSMYVHLDATVGHYVKAIIDEVLGSENFQREIIWRIGWISGYKSAAKNWIRNHDSILFYVKNKDNFVFNKEYIPYPQNYRRRDGSKPEGAGYPIEDVWNASKLDKMDSIQIKSFSREKTGYATQKNENLLQRILKASSNEGDLVGDFFCGSGTTGAVAEKLGRRWIMCDLGRFAIHTTRKRLIDIGAKPFLVQNLGKYERHRWAIQTGKYGDYLKFILDLYGSEQVSDYKHLHGKKGNKFVHIGAVDAPVTLTEIQDALNECKENNIKELDVLGWEWEMGLHDLVKEEGERAGVKLATFQIPREVLELSIRDRDLKNEITFYELAYLNVETKVEGTKVTVELKDFIIPNPELLPEEVRDKVKDWSNFIDYWAVDWMFNQHEEETEEDDTFHNMNQRYRTRKEPKLELSMDYEYKKVGRYNVLVKVIDIFGNDTTKLVEVKV